jgi:hypothetical protein
MVEIKQRLDRMAADNYASVIYFMTDGHSDYDWVRLQREGRRWAPMPAVYSCLEN